MFSLDDGDVGRIGVILCCDTLYGDRGICTLVDLIFERRTHGYEKGVSEISETITRRVLKNGERLFFTDRKNRIFQMEKQ